MQELIERLEKASGPDRQLDDAIHEIMPMPKVVEPLRYTRSIDDALTLMPEGGAWVAHGPWKDGSYCAGVSLTPEGAWDDDISGPTAAIALCIAALKARQHTKDG